LLTFAKVKEGVTSFVWELHCNTIRVKEMKMLSILIIY
jgi:hypothetical protein